MHAQIKPDQINQDLENWRDRMFEVNGVYANRIGKYTVLEINSPKMRVRYEDGSQAELNINVQARIWENIAAEMEAQEAKRSARAARQGGTINQHFLKIISLPDTDDLTFPGWPERVILAATQENVETVKKGDRIIVYLIEPQIFFAVATITSDPFEYNPKEYFFNVDQNQAHFFSIDIDAEAHSLKQAVSIDSVELESYPNLMKMRLQPESFLKMSEDDFELLAELLTEVSEDDEEDLEDDEEYEEEDIE